MAAASCCLGGWLHPSFYLGGLLRFILSRWVAAALSRGCSLMLSRRVAAAFYTFKTWFLLFTFSALVLVS
jgi:hypothetical protein